MKRILLFTFFLFSICAEAQQYHGTAHIQANDAIGYIGRSPADARVMFYDSIKALYRPFQSTAEAISYLINPINRFGNGIIVIDSGGTLQSNGTFFPSHNTFYMWADTTSNAGLVKLNLFGTGGVISFGPTANVRTGAVVPATGDYTFAQIGSTPTTISGYGITDAVSLNGTQTLTNKTISGTNNTFSSIPNSALSNSQIGLSITSNPGADVSVTTTPAALGSSLIVNFPTAGTGSRGLLSATDWNTFNGKQVPITLTVTGTSGPATFDGTTLNVPQYTAGTGCLSCNADSLKKLPVDTSSNRNGYALTFDSTNHKWVLAPNGAGTGISALTGDVTASGSGSVAATLATVNSNVGTFGSASTVGQFTVNGKGLTTAASSVAIQIAESQVTNLTTDLAAKQTTTLTSGNILVGNGSNVATSVTPSGDWTTNNAGVNVIGANKITYAKIQAAAGQGLMGATGAGNFGLITLGTNLSMTGSVLNATGASGVTQLFSKGAIQISGTDTVSFPDESFYGLIYNVNSWSSLTGLTNKGSSATVSASKIVFSGDATGAYTHTLGINGPSMLDEYTVCAKIKVGSYGATATDFAGIGHISTNSFSTTSLVGQIFLNSGTNAGKIAIEGATGSGFSQVAISSSVVSFSANDFILLTLTRNGYNVTLTARNMTTNSSTLTLTYTYSTVVGTTIFLDNTGLYSVVAGGSPFTLDSLSASSTTSVNSRLGVVGDSKLQGYYVTSQPLRAADELNQNFRSTVNVSGQGDRLIEVSSRINEIIALKPQQVFLSAGSNDIRSGRDTLLINAEYDSIVTALQSNGIVVYHGVLYETSVNLLPLVRHIAATYPANRIIDTWDVLQQPGVLQADGVHLTNFGDSLIYQTVSNFPFILFGNTKFLGGGSGSSSGGLTGTGAANQIPVFSSGTNLIGTSALTFDGNTVDLTTGSFRTSTGLTGGYDVYKDATPTSASHLGYSIPGISHLYNRFIISNFDGGTTWRPSFVMDSSGRIGIGTLNPVSKLEVDSNFNGGNLVHIGNSNTGNGAYAGIQLDVAGGGGAFYTTGSGFVTPNFTTIQTATTGDFGVFATSSSAYALTVKANKDILVNTITDVPSSILTVASTTQGALLPRMNTTQQNAISSPATGLIIYNTDSLGLVDYNGTAWLKERGAGGGSGVTTIGAFSNTSIANGGSISGSTLTFGAADATNPGMLKNTGSQTVGVTLTQPAPLFTSLTSAGANDSVLTVDPSTGQVHRRSGTTNLFFANGLTAAGGDSAYLGGTLNQNTTLGTAGFNFSITGLPNKNQASTDTSVIIDNTGKVFKSLLTQLGVVTKGTWLADPINGAQGGLGRSSYTIGEMFVAVSTTNPGGTVTPNATTTPMYLTQSGNGTQANTPTWGSSLKYGHTIFTPTTGGSVNLVNNQYNIINPSGALLALTVNLPTSPANNDVVYIKFTQNVTTVTYANGTVVDGITAPTAGGVTILVFDSGTTSWY